MTNTQSNADTTAEVLHEFHAPTREKIATLRDMKKRYDKNRSFILQHHPNEKIEDFPALDDIETLSFGDLDIRGVFCKIAHRVVEDRAIEVQEEVDEANRLRDEKLRQQSMNPLEARIEKLERALSYQGMELAKLRGTQHGPLPALPHVPKAEVPQFLGMPHGMGRHAVLGPAAANAGVRKVGNGSPAPASADAGWGQGRCMVDALVGTGKG